MWVSAVCNLIILIFDALTLLHSEQPKLCGVLAVLGATELGFKRSFCEKHLDQSDLPWSETKTP